ncbi:MAG: hypothetical protein PVG39_15305 [Desulfobacteraceae bacterium]|jgi:nanoRNase/pAp phosphatase (c-di-AMP/oligoRNAs hydrolase)
MGDPEKVNAQVVDSLSVASQATMKPDIVRIEGAGKAYQSVAQSMAIAIQDATDNLRNLNTISTTAQGVAMAKYLETKESDYGQIIEQAQKMSTEAAETFRLIGTNAADVLKGFPSG